MFGFFCPLACAITYKAAHHHHEAAVPATDHRGCAGARCIVIAWSSGMTYVCQSAHPITFAQPGTMALVHNAQCHQDAELLFAACTGNSVRDRGMQLPMRRAPMPWVSLPHARRSNAMCNSPMRLRRQGWRAGRQQPEQTSGGGWPWLQRLTDPVHVKKMSVEHLREASTTA